MAGAGNDLTSRALRKGVGLELCRGKRRRGTLVLIFREEDSNGTSWHRQIHL